jgi:hypothetical protein
VSLAPECVAAGPHPEPPTPRQQEVLDAILRYCRALRTPACPASYVADQLHLDYQTVRREHFAALHRKGWLLTDAAPARPRDFLLRGPRPGAPPTE